MTSTEIERMADLSAERATIQERGNGWPDVGEYVPGDDGELYRVVSMSGPIHTGGPGVANYIHATVELADWTDLEDGEEPAENLAVLEVQS